MAVLNEGAVQETEVADAPPSPAASTPMLDFLGWVAGGPRSYADAMEAWRSSRPRFTIWEDALGDGLIRLQCEAGAAMSETLVVLTPRGRAVLDGP
jgi:hypothetical protein